MIKLGTIMLISALFLLVGCAKTVTEVENGVDVKIMLLDCPYETVENASVNVREIDLPIDSSREACEIVMRAWTELCGDYPGRIGSCDAGSGAYDKWMPQLNISCKDCYVSPGKTMEICGAYFYINKTTSETWGRMQYCLELNPLTG